MKQSCLLVAIVVLVSFLVPFSPSQAASGDLIKGTSSAVYYVTAAGARLAFPNEATYFSWYKDFQAVRVVSDEQVASLPLAGLVTLRPGLTAIRVESDNGTYVVAHGGVLRRLQTDALAQMIFGSDWQKKIITIPAAFFVSYKSGESITAGGQYWWKNESDSSPDIAHDLVAVANNAPSTPVLSVNNNQITTPGETTMAVTTVPKTTTKKTINLAVGLWNPHDPDRKSALPEKNAITQLLFGKDKSVADYYSQMSGGSVTMNNAGVFGWYDADKPASHYWATPDPTDADGDGFINGHNEKWAETILKMDKEFDFSAYDANHDGVLSPDELGVLIVIPTDNPFGSNRVVYAQEYPTDKPMIVDGVKIGMIAEWYTGSPPNFGVVAHELSHLFFNTTDMYLDSPFRANNLSLMDGSYCNCYLDPWHRLAMGKNWLNVIKPTGDGNYALPPVNTSDTVMEIPRPGSDEFLILEYRQNDKYQETGVPGLLIWDILKPSTDGDWGRDNIHLLRANGGTPVDDKFASYRGTEGHPVATGNIHWFDGSDSHISFTDIGPANETIAFKFNSK